MVVVVVVVVVEPVIKKPVPGQLSTLKKT